MRQQNDAERSSAGRPGKGEDAGVRVADSVSPPSAERPRPLAPRRYVVTERWLAEVQVEVVARSKDEARRKVAASEGNAGGTHHETANYSQLRVRDQDIRRV